MYLENPIGDGGWWQYFEGLIRKYGVVPASAMPETKQSASHRPHQRSAEHASPQIHRRNPSHASGRQERSGHPEIQRTERLGDIYRLLVCAYGKPPKEFVFRYEDDAQGHYRSRRNDSTKKADTCETKVLVDHTYTPESFFKEFYGDLSTEYVAIVNNPAKKDRTLFEMISSRNIFEQPDIRFLNLPIASLKEYTYKMIKDSQIVWFACDVGRDNYRDSGMFAGECLGLQRHARNRP